MVKKEKENVNVEKGDDLMAKKEETKKVEKKESKRPEEVDVSTEVQPKEPEMAADEKEKEEETINEETAGVETPPTAKAKKEKKTDAPAFPTPKSEAERETEALQKAQPGREELIAAELELRRYVSRSGGYRDGSPPKNQKRADQLLKFLGRDELVWDTTLIP